MMGTVRASFKGLLLLSLVGCGGGTLDIGKPAELMCPALQTDLDEVILTGTVFGVAKEQQLVVANNCEGEGDLSIEAFSLDDPGGVFAHDGEPVVLGPGDVIALQLVFTAHDYVEHTANLIILSDDPDGPLQVPVLGSADPDQDGDGYRALEAGGDDCDDFEASANPGATETRDLIDNDCDGLVDEGFVERGDILITELMLMPTAVSENNGQWFEVFNDGDYAINMVGWQIEGLSGEHVIAESLVVQPGVHAVLAVQLDPEVNGGVEADYAYPFGELPLQASQGFLNLRLDGETLFYLDWNNGWTFASGRSTSLDHVRYTVSQATDPKQWCLAVSGTSGGHQGTPGALNDYCTSVDHDGDGFSEDDGDCDDANRLAYPGAEEVWDGFDNDCDGRQDNLAVVDVATGYVDGETYNEYLGQPGFIGWGDVDADGKSEIIVTGEAADFYGAAYVLDVEDVASYKGSVTDYATTAATSQIWTNKLFSVGQEMADNSGDGFANLVVAGNRYYSAESSANALAVYGDWQMGDDLGSRDAYWGFRPDDLSYAWFGGAVASSQDINGDGVAEVVYGDPLYYTGTGGYRGQVHVLDVEPLGPGDYTFSEASLRSWKGEGHRGVGGVFGEGDIDGDGYGDVVVGEHSYNTGADGRFYMMMGATRLPTGDLDKASTATFDEFSGNAGVLGVAARPQIGDFDGDGTQDLAIGDPDDQRVWIYLDAGTLTGTYDDTDADVTIHGGSGTHAFGRHLTSGDFNGDGVDDLVVGAPGAVVWTPAKSTGVVYIYEGGSGFAGVLYKTDAWASFDGPGADRLGTGLAALDMDSDGLDDLVLAAPGVGSINQGRVYFVLMP